MTIQTRKTSSPAVGSKSASVKKRPVTYISTKDPRNNPAYINSHPGQVVVLSEAEFAKYIKTQLLPANAASAADSEALTDYPNAINDLNAPGKPSWDTTSISYDASDVNVTETITVTFDPAPGDPGDGSYTYHVHYDLTTLATSNAGPGTGTTGAGSSGSAVSSSQTASTTNAPVKNVATDEQSSSVITISWPGLSNATNYTISIGGENIPESTLANAYVAKTYVVPSSGGYSDISYDATGSLYGGRYAFTIFPISGHTFKSTYAFFIQANYPTGSSSQVEYDVIF